MTQSISVNSTMTARSTQPLYAVGGPTSGDEGASREAGKKARERRDEAGEKANEREKRVKRAAGPPPPGGEVEEKGNGARLGRAKQEAKPFTTFL